MAIVNSFCMFTRGYWGSIIVNMWFLGCAHPSHHGNPWNTWNLFSERIDHHPLRAGYTIQVLTWLSFLIRKWLVYQVYPPVIKQCNGKSTINSGWLGKASTNGGVSSKPCFIRAVIGEHCPVAITPPLRIGVPLLQSIAACRNLWSFLLRGKWHSSWLRFKKKGVPWGTSRSTTLLDFTNHTPSILGGLIYVVLTGTWRGKSKGHLWKKLTWCRCWYIDSRPSEPKCSHKAKALRDTTTFYGDTRQPTKQWKQHQWRICWDLFVPRFVSTISQKVLLKYSSPKKKSMFPEICSKRKNFHGRKTRTSQKKWIIIIIRSHPNTNNHPTLWNNIQQVYLEFLPVFFKAGQEKETSEQCPKSFRHQTWLATQGSIRIGHQKFFTNQQFNPYCLVVQ